MVQRLTTLVVIFSVVALALFSLRVEGQEAATPAASPAAGTATAQQVSPVASPGATPVAGEVDLVAAERGKAAAAVCLACHSADGSQLVGPTWKGLYGSEVELEDGSKVVADEAYLHESIVDPMKRTVKGFPPSMPPFGAMLTEDQIKDVIEYIKSLK